MPPLLVVPMLLVVHTRLLTQVGADQPQPRDSGGLLRGCPPATMAMASMAMLRGCRDGGSHTFHPAWSTVAAAHVQAADQALAQGTRLALVYPRKVPLLRALQQRLLQRLPACLACLQVAGGGSLSAGLGCATWLQTAAVT